MANVPDQIVSNPVIPSGTVTFLFTDIEGSTQLAQDYPDRIPSLLEQHHAILSACIHRHKGIVFQVIGDAFCAAFHTPTDALQAAVEAQRKLHQEAWDPIPLRVRMGIHTGGAQAKSIDDVRAGYQGYLTLTRTQRIMSAAHGGQVLLSNPTAELLSSLLPKEITLRDLGSHRFKGLVNPEHLWQVVASDLPQEFPPIRSLKFIPSNLPLQLTSFIARESEIEEVKAALASTRLLTLTGVGGIGKTRLAVQVAAECIDLYPNGTWFVELAPLTDPELIPTTTTKTLGIRGESSRPAMDHLIDFLSSRQLLLILDNCEHLIEACAQLADKLLRACPKLSILATSREALRIGGESIHPVPPMELPDPGAGTSTNEAGSTEAVRLFVARAKEVQPHFALKDENVRLVLQICKQLDGIPLAIELAAARMKVLSVEMLRNRLHDRFRLLTTGSRSAQPRQQTLRATIDWSYNLLTQPEQELFKHLSLFVGGFTLEAAEAIYGEDGNSFAVLDLLDSLVDKSLFVLEESHADGRYSLLETIRQYAWEKLQESGESRRLIRRYLDFYLVLAKRAEPEFFRTQQKYWLDLLEAELDNLRNALQLSLDVGDESSSTAGLEIAVATEQFWMVRGYVNEARMWLEKFLAQPMVNRRSSLYARALWFSSRLLWNQGQMRQLQEFYEQILAIGEENQDKRVMAEGTRGLGIMANFRNDQQTANEKFLQSLALFREIDYLPGIAQVLSNLALTARFTGDLSLAHTYYQENLAVCQKLGHQLGIAGTLLMLGEMEVNSGKFEHARAYYKESIAIYRLAEDKSGLASSLVHIGDVFRRNGDLEKAVSSYEEGLAIFRDLGDPTWTAAIPIDLGFVAMLQEDIAQARSYFVDSLRRSRQLDFSGNITALAIVGMAGTDNRPENAVSMLAAVEPYLKDKYYEWAVYGVFFERIRDAAREQLAEADFNRAWNEGQAMGANGLEALVEEAIKGG